MATTVGGDSAHLDISGAVEVTNDSGNPLPVSGTVAVSNLPATQAVSGPLTDTQLRATSVPVTVSDGSGPLTVDGTVGVSNFPVTQPVSGPLTDTQLRASSVPVTVSDGSGPLTVDGTVSVSNFPATQPVSGTIGVNNFPATQPVSGPLTDTQLRASSVPVTVSDGSGPLTVDGNVVVTSGTPTGTSVTGTPGAYLMGLYGSGNVLVTAAAVSAIADGVNGSQTASGIYAFNGTTWDRIRTASNGVLLVEERAYPFVHISTATTVTAKSGAGKLASVVINNRGVGGTITLYDNTAGSGVLIAVIDPTANVVPLIYNLAFATGLTIVTTGATPADITVTYR